MKPAATAIVVFAALLFLFADILRHSQYTPDGFIYTWIALQDSGHDAADAANIAKGTYQRTALFKLPRYHRTFTRSTADLESFSRAFRNRPLYPYLTAALLPFLGLRAPFAVSAIAYFVFSMLLFWLLSHFGRPATAAGLTIAVIALPLTRGLAANDLTDMLAAVWWTLGLGALVRLVRVQTPFLLAALGLAAILLTLSRPEPYQLIMPALAIALLRKRWLPFFVSCCGAAVFVIEAIRMPFGIREQLHWEFEHRTSRAGGTTLKTWYLSGLANTVRYTLDQSIRTVAPAIATIAGIYGLVRPNWRDEVIVLFCALAACLLAIPLNPVQWSIARLIGFPLIPVFAAMIQAALCTASSRTATALAV